MLFCYEKSQFDDVRGATAANQLSQLQRQLSSASVVVRKWSRSPRASVRRGNNNNNQAAADDEDEERQHLSINNNHHHQLANGDAEKHLSSLLFRRSSTKTTNGSQRSFAAVTAATKLRKENNDNNSSAGSSFRSFLNVNNNSCQNSRPVSRVSSVVMFERDNASNINVIAPLLPNANSGASTPINNPPSPMGDGSNPKLESATKEEEQQKQSEGANKKKSAFRETRI